MATITKCDVCGKKLKSFSLVHIRFGWGLYDVCQGCGKPLIEFMIKNKILNKKDLAELEA